MRATRELPAYGFIEIKGLGNAIEVADAMLKAANVTIQSQIQTDPAMITLLAVGDHGACHAALSAGLEKAHGRDIVVSWKLIGRPEPDINLFIPRKATPPATNDDGASSEGTVGFDAVMDSVAVANASETQNAIRDVLLSELKRHENGLLLSQFPRASSVTMKTIKRELDYLVKDGLVTRYQSIFKLNIENHEQPHF